MQIACKLDDKNLVESASKYTDYPSYEVLFLKWMFGKNW